VGGITGRATRKGSSRCRSRPQRPLDDEVSIELPGIVHRFAAEHRLVVVLAGGDMAYRGSTAPQPVTLTTGGGRTQQLTVPVVV
jgi:hypothetical protein